MCRTIAFLFSSLSPSWSSIFKERSIELLFLKWICNFQNCSSNGNFSTDCVFFFSLLHYFCVWSWQVVLFVPMCQAERLRWNSTPSSLSWTGTVCCGRKQSSSLTWSQRRTPATLTVCTPGFMCLWSTAVTSILAVWVVQSFPDTAAVRNAHFTLNCQLIYFITSLSLPFLCQRAPIVITTSIRTMRMTPMTTSRWRSDSFPHVLLASARSGFVSFAYFPLSSLSHCYHHFTLPPPHPPHSVGLLCFVTHNLTYHLRLFDRMR